jgi:hypothetical protein
MAKSGDNVLVWVLLLGAGIFFVYRRHSNNEASGAAPPAAAAAAPGPHRFRQTVLPAHHPVVAGGVPTAPPPGVANYAHGGCGCGGHHDGGYISSWEDLDEDVPMYAVAPQKSYGDVGDLF